MGKTTTTASTKPQFSIFKSRSTMSGTTKYTAAPQRDSFDETANYSQAPPSYADQPSSSANDQEALLGGAPRSSEDNIPDDFKFGGSVSEASIDSHGLCPQSLRYSFCSTYCNCGSEFCLLLQRILQICSSSAALQLLKHTQYQSSSRSTSPESSYK